MFSLQGWLIATNLILKANKFQKKFLLKKKLMIHTNKQTVVVCLSEKAKQRAIIQHATNVAHPYILCS